METNVRTSRLLGLCVLFCALLLIFGCSSAGTAGHSNLAANGPFAGLPPIPMDVPGHNVSDVHNASINGVDTLLRSPGAINSGQNLLLFTGETLPPSIEWGLYRYIPDSGQSEVVNKVDFGFTVNVGPNGWIGIANYGTGMWEFRGPYNEQGGGGSKSFDNLELGDYTSPAGNLYFIALAYNGSTMTFNGLSITSDVTPSATFAVSGRAIDSSTSQGIAGAQITLSGVGTVSTNATGNFTFSGVATNTYTLTAATVAGYNPFTPVNIPVSITNADSTGNDFSATPSGPVGVTYETGAGEIKTLIDDRCVYCHSPTGPGGPQTPYLRDWSEVSANLSLIDLYVLTFQTMPKLPKTLLPAERQKFQDWKDNSHAQ